MRLSPRARVSVLLTGLLLFSALSALGRDAASLKACVIVNGKEVGD